MRMSAGDVHKIQVIPSGLYPAGDHMNTPFAPFFSFFSSAEIRWACRHRNNKSVALKHKNY